MPKSFSRGFGFFVLSDTIQLYFKLNFDWIWYVIVNLTEGTECSFTNTVWMQFCMFYPFFACRQLVGGEGDGVEKALSINERARKDSTVVDGKKQGFSSFEWQTISEHCTMTTKARNHFLHFN